MSLDPQTILRVLDERTEASHFPMLDNGYVFLAATRLTLHRSDSDWSMVFESFGFSPRGMQPDVTIQTFGSRLHNRKTAADFVKKRAYKDYLKANPTSEFHSGFPVEPGDWQNPEICELVVNGAELVRVRGRDIRIPTIDAVAEYRIVPEDPPNLLVFELCRYLAEVARELVLATPEERCFNVPPDMEQILQLEEWTHPNIVDDELPSEVEGFQQLARVLSTGSVDEYGPTTPPNTHWSNWPEGGRL